MEGLGATGFAPSCRSTNCQLASSIRANIPHDVEGRRTALHWAMTDQPPPSSPRIALRSPTACAELRQCIQHCYALSLSRRYNKTKDAASQHLANK